MSAAASAAEAWLVLNRRMPFYHQGVWTWQAPILGSVPMKNELPREVFDRLLEPLLTGVLMLQASYNSRVDAIVAARNALVKAQSDGVFSLES